MLHEKKKKKKRLPAHYLRAYRVSWSTKLGAPNSAFAKVLFDKFTSSKVVLKAIFVVNFRIKRKNILHRR